MDSWAAAQEEPEVNFYVESMDSLDSNILNQRTEEEVTYDENLFDSHEVPALHISEKGRGGGAWSASRHSDSSGRGSGYEPASIPTLQLGSSVLLPGKEIQESRRTGAVLPLVRASGHERLNNNPLAKL